MVALCYAVQATKVTGLLYHILQEFIACACPSEGGPQRADGTVFLECTVCEVFALQAERKDEAI
jgi:hypothetical protein